MARVSQPSRDLDHIGGLGAVRGQHGLQIGERPPGLDDNVAVYDLAVRSSGQLAGDEKQIANLTGGTERRSETGRRLGHGILSRRDEADKAAARSPAPMA